MGREFGCLVCAVVLSAFSTIAHAGVLLRFDQSEYRANPGETIQVNIILDADDQTSGENEVLPVGLFSMAFQLTFDGQQAEVPHGDGGHLIELPDALDDDGLGGPPVLQVGSGFARIRAALDFSASDVYRGVDRGRGTQMWLASIPITVTGTENFTLELSLFRRGPNDQVFIDGQGNPLDNDLTFASAAVVIPEPSTVGVLILSGILGAIGQRKN